MKKKVFLLVLLSFALLSGLFALTRAEYLASKHVSDILPVDSMVGQTADSDSSENHAALAEALSEEFSFEWLETYLAPGFRDTAAKLWSGKLSSVLPATQFVMSKGKTNADSSISISVRLAGTDTVIHFAVRDGLIEAMGF